MLVILGHGHSHDKSEKCHNYEKKSWRTWTHSW